MPLFQTLLGGLRSDDPINPNVVAVPDKSAADRYRSGGTGNRPVVPVDVGDRETDDMELTLLERWDSDPCFILDADQDEIDEIRRAIAIAQAVEEKSSPRYWHANDWREWIMCRADELLEGK